LNSVAIAGLTLVVDPRDVGCRVHRSAVLPANTRRDGIGARPRPAMD